MAHGDDARRLIRGDYVFGQIDLEAAAVKAGIPIATVRRWKREALAAGDDWERARSAQMIAGGGIEDVMRQSLAAMMQQTQTTIQWLQSDAVIPPLARVEAISKLGDALNKMVAAMKRGMPETDALAVRLDTIKRLGDFVRTKHPRHVNAFAEILEPFAQEVSSG
jgi:uncharacterized protein YjcR